MKYYIKFVLLLAFVSCGTRNIAPVTAQGSEPSFQIFFDNLSPYGFWTLHPDYGYVWIPDAGPDFVPYFTDGHWVYSRYGWTWVSYFDWGWAPFHYGRWDWDDLYGWYWVPGNEWGPAWVIWRRAAGYYGWTPMSPGLTVNVHVGIYRDRPDRWIFVRDRDIVRDDFHRYRLGHSDNITIINNSTVINKTYVDNRRNTTYVAGPELQEVQRVSGRRISPVQIQDNQRPGSSLSGNQLEIYRPNVRRSASGNQKPAPERVMDINEVRSRRSSAPTSDPGELSSPGGSNRRGTDMQEPPAQQRDMAPQQESPGTNNRRNVSPPVSQPEYERMPSRSQPSSQPSEPSQNNRRGQEPSSVPQQQREIQRQEPAPSAPSQQKTEPSEPRRRESTEPQPQQQTKPSENQSQPSNNRRQSRSSSNNEQQQKQQKQGGSRR